MSAEADRLYGVQLGVGAAGLLLTVAAVVAAWVTVDIDAAGGRHVAVAGAGVSYPAANVAGVVMLALALLGVAVLFVAGREARREVKRQRAVLGRLATIGPLGSDPRVLVFADPEPYAFCGGLLHPRVYVSTGAVEALEPDELDAVLAHEERHRRARDPLRLLAGRVLERSLFFLPVLRPLNERSGALAEIAADAEAVRVSGGPAPLAAAMLRFRSTGSGELVGVAPERVDWLIGAPPAWRFPSLMLGVALGTVVALFTVVWRVSAVASVRTSLAPPVISNKPCVLVLALVPVLAVAAALAVRARVAER